MSDQPIHQNSEINKDQAIAVFKDINKQTVLTLKQSRQNHKYEVTDEFDFINRQPQTGAHESEVLLAKDEQWLQLDFTRIDSDGNETTDFDESARLASMQIFIVGLLEILNELPAEISPDTKVVSWGATFRFGRFLANSLGFKYITNFQFEPDEEDPADICHVIGTLGELAERAAEIKRVLDNRQ